MGRGLAWEPSTRLVSFQDPGTEHAKLAVLKVHLEDKVATRVLSQHQAGK